MPNIVVIGSANMDTTNYLEGEFPQNLTAENNNTIIKSSQVLGGKGANQAVSTKKQLSSTNDEVYFIGCIGKDKSGLEIIENFQKQGINYSGVKVLNGQQTDGRVISVDIHGENRMIGYGDCIKHLMPNMLKEERVQSVINKAEIIMIQMKMPKDTIEYMIDYCNSNNKKILVDPTPLQNSSALIEKGLLDKITYLTPNEEEAYALALYEKGYNCEEVSKMYEKTTKQQRLEEIINVIKKHPNIIATLGENGVVYNNNGRIAIKSTYATQCKDSTGAGDTFNGAFVAAIVRGEDVTKSIDYAIMASSIKIAHEGAQSGIPTLEETEQALANMKSKNMGGF